MTSFHKGYLYPTGNYEKILVRNASKASNIEEMKVEIKVDSIQAPMTPMTPTSGSIPNLIREYVLRTMS